MTPELKTACEVIFQEHKIHPIKWNRDTFRGRISIGLSEIAKETLIKKHIVFLTGKSKKIITLLNPAVATASNFEEAEEMVKNDSPAAPTNIIASPPAYSINHVNGFDKLRSGSSNSISSVENKPQIDRARIKWYLKPLFSYVIWPACAIVAGVLITFLIDIVYRKFFLD